MPPADPAMKEPQMTEQQEQSSPEWEVFLVDSGGFTVRGEARARTLLALLDDEAAIEREFGDCYPETITVCRGAAQPQPQFPGSTFLRQPSSRRMIDFVDFDLSDEDPERALLLWRAAHGIAQALNSVEVA